ncbi:MAG: PIN domain-containing protein, partial [Treponema sp.]|nr:PIN domain-containing protein [Treponema sp.]
MNGIYVLDACSLIALLTNENGADIVKNLLQRAMDAEIKVLMHKINFLEVYYDTYKTYGEEKALKLLEDIKITPIKINTEINDDILIKGGRLKAMYKMSLVDSIGLAEAVINDG